MDITNIQGKVTLDSSIVPLNQSTPEKRIKVHILRGLSLKVVTLEFIIRETSIFFQKYILVENHLLLLQQFLNLIVHSKEFFSSTRVFSAILIAYFDVFHSSHDL